MIQVMGVSVESQTAWDSVDLLQGSFGPFGPRVGKRCENEFAGPLGPRGPKSPKQSRKRFGNR